MLYEVNNSNVDRFVAVLNANIIENIEKDYRFTMFCDRTPKPLVKVLICTEKEWLTFYQFVISSEHIKSNIDIISETYINTSTFKKLKEVLIERKEYHHEETHIIDFRPSTFRSNGL